MIITFNHEPYRRALQASRPKVWFTRPLPEEKSHSLDELLSGSLPRGPINHSLIRDLWDWAQTPAGAALWHFNSSLRVSAVLRVFIPFCFNLRLVCICISHQETKKDDPRFTICSRQHFNTSSDTGRGMLNTRDKVTGLKLQVYNLFGVI